MFLTFNVLRLTNSVKKCHNLLLSLHNIAAAAAAECPGEGTAAHKNLSQQRAGK